jgi:hypothetical protein
MELFGQALPDERVRSYLRTALQAGPGDVSLRATLYSPAVDFTVDRAEPGVLVQVGAPACGARLPGPAPPGLRGRTAYRAMTTRPHRRIVAIAAPRACERTARRKTPDLGNSGPAAEGLSAWERGWLCTAVPLLKELLGELEGDELAQEGSPLSCRLATCRRPASTHRPDHQGSAWLMTSGKLSGRNRVILTDRERAVHLPRGRSFPRKPCLKYVFGRSSYSPVTALHGLLPKTS